VGGIDCRHSKGHKGSRRKDFLLVIVFVCRFFSLANEIFPSYSHSPTCSTTTTLVRFPPLRFKCIFFRLIRCTATRSAGCTPSSVFFFVFFFFFPGGDCWRVYCIYSYARPVSCARRCNRFTHKGESPPLFQFRSD
jgi:hypothetical protein